MVFQTLAAALFLFAGVQEQDCEELQSMIRDTYDFVPSQLSADQKDEAANAMDRVWKYVEGKPAETLGCLRAALLDENANPWFLFDGSSLLVSVDPSHESKALQVRLWCSANLDDVHRQYWLETLALRGNEGFDVSVAGDRWLTHENASYLVPRHGLFEVGPYEGAMFLFGSMDEAYATPGLLRIVRDEAHPGRLVAISLLLLQGTPDAWRAVAEIDDETLPATSRESLSLLRSTPPRIPVGDTSVELSREHILNDLRASLGDETATPLPAMTSEADWLASAVSTLQPEDVDLLRRARRRRVTVSSDEAVYEYMMYSAAIQVLTWAPEYFER